MVARVVLTLEQPEYRALLQVAQTELRNPADQAHFMVRQELVRRGFIQDAQAQTVPEQALQDAQGN